MARARDLCLEAPAPKPKERVRPESAAPAGARPAPAALAACPRVPAPVLLLPPNPPFFALICPLPFIQRTVPFTPAACDAM